MGEPVEILQARAILSMEDRRVTAIERAKQFLNKEKEGKVINPDNNEFIFYNCVSNIKVPTREQMRDFILQAKFGDEIQKAKEAIKIEARRSAYNQDDNIEIGGNDVK